MMEQRDAEARSLILGRLRDILGDRPPADAEYRAISRTYRQAGSFPAGRLSELFVERLEHYQVGVRRCAPGDVAIAVRDVVTARGKSRLLVPDGVPRDWLLPEVEAVADRGLSWEALDRAEGVLTGCSVGVASTGTIVLQHGPAEGRRALTLVPDYHLCVVFEHQVVQTVPEAIRQLRAAQPALVTTISGPSATADIEMTRIRGVHGPRTLDVVLVDA